jgi:hypothetical protein
MSGKWDFKITSDTSRQWLTSIIPATWEAEIRRMVVQCQSGLKSLPDPISTGKR